jgi:hypothetical protein
MIEGTPAEMAEFVKQRDGSDVTSVQRLAVDGISGAVVLDETRKSDNGDQQTEPKKKEKGISKYGKWVRSQHWNNWSSIEQSSRLAYWWIKHGPSTLPQFGEAENDALVDWMKDEVRAARFREIAADHAARERQSEQRGEFQLLTLQKTMALQYAFEVSTGDAQAVSVVLGRLISGDAETPAIVHVRRRLLEMKRESGGKVAVARRQEPEIYQMFASLLTAAA